MLKTGSRPSFTSLVAFILIVAPVVYVLSYAPVVRVCGRTVESGLPPDLDIPFRPGTHISTIPEFEGFEERITVADGTLYPAYHPADWLIEHTSLRGPLLLWADLWGVRQAFELSETERFLLDQSRVGSSGR